MVEAISQVFSTFGAAVFVPVVLIIVALLMGVKPKKAVSAGLSAGIGLTGFSMVTGGFTPVLSPIIQKMVDNAGVSLSVLDTGWQQASMIGYSTQIGLIFFGLAILIQLALFLSKWSNVLQVSDLWNNYSYMVWGSLLFIMTGNIWLALGLMIVQLLWTTLFSEMLAKRFASYYQYPNCTMCAAHHLEALPFAIAINWLLNKLKLYKVKLNPDTLRARFGILGEPMFLGLILGAIIAVIGNINALGTLAAWGEIAKVAITTSAVMVVFPKIASIFAGAFTPLTEASKKRVMKSGKGRSEWYLAVNPAVGYGETATLTTGIVLIPIILFVSFFLPGNETLPLVDLISLPYMVIVFIAITNGNIVKSIIGAGIWYSLALLVCTAMAPAYTDVAASLGATIPDNAVYIISFTILSKPLLALFFYAFLSGNPLFIALTVVGYFVATFLWKKNRAAVTDFIEKQALME